MPERKQTDLIVIHCSATPPTMDIGADTIRKWHTDPPPKGRGWSDIGYHFVIKRDGTIENGRPMREVGAHVEGHNWNTVGVCMVGGTDAAGHSECNFTDEQWASLKKTVRYLRSIFGNIPLKGHHDLFAGKDCPSFNVGEWAERNGLAV